MNGRNETHEVLSRLQSIVSVLTKPLATEMLQVSQAIHPCVAEQLLDEFQLRLFLGVARTKGLAEMTGQRLLHIGKIPSKGNLENVLTFLHMELTDVYQAALTHGEIADHEALERVWAPLTTPFFKLLFEENPEA